MNYRQGLNGETSWEKGIYPLKLHAVEIGISKLAYDVSLEIVDYVGGNCNLTLVVRKDLYNATDVHRMAAGYERLIEAFVADASLGLDEIELFAPLDVQRALQLAHGKFPSNFPEGLLLRFLSSQNNR